MDKYQSYLLECTYIPPDPDEEVHYQADGFTEYDDYLYDKYVDEQLEKELETNGRTNL